MSREKRGILLVNLGTPAEPTPKAVRQFLKAFLSDPRVVDLPRLIWLPILYLIILVFRPKKVAQAYKEIWSDAGSPLLVYSKAQTRKLQEALLDNQSFDFKVELGMTYGEPSISSAIEKLKQWGAKKIVVLPLYPQYSVSTTASVYDQIKEYEHDQNIEIINNYHDSRFYIEALEISIVNHLGDHFSTEYDKLILSFHGIPKRYVTNGDPYESQCRKTATLLQEKLGLPDSKFEFAFQSRFGREEWLRPYFDERMTEMPKEGTKSIITVCPGFSSDCLETLEEIAIGNKELFIESGGERFAYVPALNDSSEHIIMMQELILSCCNKVTDE